jgi:uridine kinase
MKIAVVISGYLRGFKENVNSIKNNIIQNHDCDIYMHITEDNNDDKYYNKNITIEYIKSELKPKILLISANLFFSQNKNINNLLNQNYKFFWLNEERKKICKIENIHYDLIIKIRPDVHILSKLNYDMDIDCVYIPSDSKIDTAKLQNHDDKYICDIIAYGTTQKMDEYFNYYLQINYLVKTYGIVNETLLYHYFVNNNIEYILVNIDYFVILSLCNTIAVTGDSGSGKTTISNILLNLFDNSFILECDRYHKWERSDKNWENITHLNPEANYITKMYNDIFDLKIGNSIYHVDYDHSTGKFTNLENIESKENIIVCGLHTLYIQDNIINLKIYMDTDENLKIYWKIKRDIKKRGYSINKILSQIESRKEDFIKYIYPQKKNADIIINLFTDKEFNINNFTLDEEFNIFLRIGIKETFEIKNIITKLEVAKLEKKDNFFYLYFDKLEDYEKIVKTIIINL